MCIRVRIVLPFHELVPPSAVTAWPMIGQFLLSVTAAAESLESVAGAGVVVSVVSTGALFCVQPADTMKAAQRTGRMRYRMDCSFV